MTLIVTSEFELQRIAPPNLPLAEGDYSQQYQDQLNNVLRLYFNRLQAILNQLDTNASTAALLLPYGAFHQDGATVLTANMTNNSTTPIQVTSTAEFLAPGALLIGGELIKYTGKTPTTFTGITRGAYSTTNVAHTAGDAVTEALGVSSPTVASSLPFTATDASFGIELDPLNPSHVVCSTAGVYNFTFSAQFLNFTSAEDNVTVWFKKNGSDIPYSAGLVQVNSKHGSSPGASIVSWNLIVDMNVGDYIELYFSSNTGNTVCATYPAGVAPVHPISPSLILTATFVSALP